MWRLGIAALVIIYVIGLCGCGGGSGGSSSSVSIQSFSVFNHPGERRVRFVPMSVSIVAGSSSGARWVNQDTIAHEVVSGTVIPDGNPATIRTITVNSGFFTPDLLNARAGDTIRFNNLSGRQFTLVIADADNAVISTVVLDQGEMQDVPFPGPGVYFARDSDSQQIATITLAGTPVPDGRFDSGVLQHGEVFTRIFSTPGNYPYYDANPTNPGNVYSTGTVIVQ